MNNQAMLWAADLALTIGLPLSVRLTIDYAHGKSKFGFSASFSYGLVVAGITWWIIYING